MTLRLKYGISANHSLWIGNVPVGYRPNQMYFYSSIVGSTGESFNWNILPNDGAINGVFNKDTAVNEYLCIFAVWATNFG